MPSFLTNVMCYDFTFPVGIINSLIYSFDFCSDITEDSTELTNENKQFDSRKGDDIKSGSKIDILNKEISTLIQGNFQTSHISQIAENTSQIDCLWGMPIDREPTQIEMDNYHVLEQSEHAPYQIQQRKYYNKKEGKYEDFVGKTYHCCPTSSQVIVEKAVKKSEISSKNKQEIINKITGHVKDTLSERGANKVAVDASVETMSTIHNQLISNVDTSVYQITDQEMNVTMDMNYIDNYGVCGIDPITGKSKSKQIKQKINLEAISKNIINTTIDIIMENDDSIESTSTVTVNRIDNRVILGSILWDIICLYLCIYILRKLF